MHFIARSIYKKMHSKQISSSGSSFKILFGIALLAVFLYYVVNAITGDLERRDWIMALLIFPALIWLYWYSFSDAHPVYFDSSFLYFTRFGKKYSVPCSNITEVSILSSRGVSSCELSFYDNHKKEKTIHFSLVFGSSPRILLRELEIIVQHTNPKFEISY
jgi:hypothetical protein